MRKTLYIALFCVMLIALFPSCEDTPVSVSDIVEYSTPTIKGTITIPDGSDVKPDEVYVKVIDSDDKTVTIQKASSDGTFVIQNLSQDMTYKILFTSEEPEFNNRSVTRGKGSGVGGWLKDVVPAIKEGNNVGSVKMKPLGTIKGRAFISGATQHYDITVYIPGTSYSAITDRDGNFSIYSVPEGTYTLRYILDDHVPYMMSNVMLICPDDVENPEKTVGNVTLYSNKGTVVGRAVLGDASDSTGINIKLESEDKSVSYDSSTSSDGSYTLSGVAPGRYRIIASYSTYTPVYTGYFTVETATVTTVNDRLELLGVYGTISGSASLSLSSSDALQILLKRTDGEDSYSVLTGTDGTFTKKVKPGIYTVTASYPDYESRSMTVTVVENGEVRTDFIALVSSYGTVTGYSASSGETVNLIDSTGRAVSSVNTADDRSYVLNSVTPGTYSVQFSKTGYASYTVTSVYVTKGGTVSVNGETLKSSYGTISGTSASVGETVSLIRGSSVIYSVTTSSDRKYEFSNLPSGVYSLEFSKDGYSSYETVSYSVEDGSSLTVNGKALTSIYGTVSGKSSTDGETVTLLNSKGTPEKTVESGTDGSYTFTKISAGTYSVRFSKDGYVSYTVSDVLVTVGNTTTVNGETLVSLYGKISGTSYSADETVTLLRGTTAADTAVTSSSKTYEFKDIAEGTYTVRFSKEGYSDYTSPSVTVTNGSSNTVNGQKLVSIYGTVSGKSASSGESVSLFDSIGTPVKTVESGADGSYSFTEIPAGTYSVRFSKDGYASYIVSDVLVTVGNTTIVNGETLVSLYGKISGTSYSADETVTLLRGTTAVGTAVTSSSKTYEFKDIVEGTYTVRFSKEGYSDYTSPSVTVTNGSSKIVNGQKLVSIYGTVSGKSASSGESVSLLDSKGTPVKTVESGADGSYSFTEISAGTYSVRFSKDGYASYIVSDVSVAVATTTTVNGQALVSSFGKISGTSNSIGETVSLLSNSSVIQSVTTGRDRKYEFSNIATGTYTLRFSKTGYSDYETTSYTIKNGSNLTVNGIALTSLYGSITGKSSSSGETVTLISSTGASVDTVVTSTDLKYSFDTLLPGTYSVRFSKNGYSSYTTTAVVEENKTSTINGTALVSVYGIISGKSESSGETVYLIKGTQSVKNTTTLESKEYTFADVEPGDYKVRFAKADHSSYETASFKVEAGQSYVVDGERLVAIYGTVKGTSATGGETITLIDSEGTPVSTIQSREDCSYSFNKVTAGRYSIRFSKDGYDSYTVTDVLVAVDNSITVNGEALKSSYGTVSGTTKSEGETVNLIKGATVVDTIITSSDKSYKFTKVEAGTYTVRFSKTGYSSYESTSFSVTSGSSTVINGSTLSSIYGTVSGKSASSGESVSLLDSKGTPVKTVESGADGSYSFTGISAGTYSVRFSKDGYASYIVNDVSVAVATTTTVNGQALVSSFGKISGTSNSIGETVSLLSNSSTIQSVTTGSDRKYEFSNIAVGTYTLRFTKEGYSAYETTSYTIRNGSNLTVNGKALTSLYGTISGTSYTAGETVSLLKGTSVFKTVVTSTDRTYEFDELLAGTYSIRFAKNGYASYDSDSVSITGGQTVTVNGKELVSLYGTVSGKSSTDGETVTLLNSNGTPVKAVKSGADGSYAFTNISAETYSVRFSKDGYVSYTVNDVLVIVGNTTTVNGETLVSLYGKISGTSYSADETVTLLRGTTVVDTAVTSSSKTYEFKDIAEGTYTVRFSKEGYSDYTSPSVTVTNGSSNTVNGQKLVSIYGTVSGKSATKGETVSLIQSDGTAVNTIVTSDDCTYTFTNITPGTYSVRFSKTNYANYDATDILVVADKTTTVNGETLVSSYGKIGGTSNSIGETVSLLSNSSTIQSVTTGSDRKYEFSNIAVGTYTLRFTKEGYSAYETTSYTIRNGSNLTVNGIALTSLYGSITGKSSSSGETVTLISSTGASVGNTVTGANLNYSFDTLLPGTYSVRFSKNGYSSYTATAVVEENKTSTINGTALVSVYGIISGKSESSGETVYLIKGTQSVKNTTTLESKEYSFADVEPGDYKIRFAKADYFSYETASFKVEAGQSYVIDGERLSAIYGSISGKAATSGEYVSLLDSSGTTVRTVQSSSGCTFSFTRLEPGTYSLSISKDGYFSTTVSDVIVIAGEDTAITTPSLISTNGTVSGFVTLEGSSDNSGVIITLTDSSDSENVYSEVSAADGSFRITGIKKTSNYLLTYSKDGYVSNLSNSVDVTVGKVVTADSVTLKSVMSTLSGKIQLEGASSYENTTILLKSEDNDYTATTDQKGEYRINGVLPGTYTLIASKDGYVTASTKEFVVESSSEKEVELLSLSVAVRSVTGKVTLELGTDHAGALVTATNLSDSKIVYSAITNSDGDYTLAGMVPGEYQIVISKSGYVTATLPTTNIVANTLTDVGSTELAIAKGEITGIARLEGCSDYSGITVSIVGTTFSTTTAKDGTYSFTVPTGNYSGGIRYEYEDFETTSYVANIAVLQTTSYSDAYAVPDQELKCINVPKVSGKVSVAGSTKVQYEDITISIVELPEFTFTTEADGKYTFEHVPVGTYTFEFTRENARKVTKMVAIEPSLEITIEDIELIPDAVTLYGNISLSGLSDYSGVTVRVTTSDSVELKTVTNAAGYWYIGNIIASKEHTIYFEKSGWETKSYAIAANTYEPMSLNDCTSTYSVVLEDKVAPVITSLTATVGKSTEDGREVYLYLYTQEEGSGIKYIQGNTENSLDTVTEQSYYNPFKLIIPDEVGDTTIYVRVKDATGNFSNTVSTNVTLKNDKTELYQTLSGDKLHLTYENSPYVMTDNILVPEGETLVIDPGVEIQVKGEYYIQVEGTLSAVGTEDKHIKIYGVDEGQDKWKGFKIINDNDSQITYTEITGFTEGIQGYGTINNSVVIASADGYSLGSDDGYYFKGRVMSSSISGKVFAFAGDILNSTINSDYLGELNVSGSIFNNEFTGKLEGTISGSLIQNTFSGTGNLKFNNVYMMNNKVDVSNVTVEDSIVKYTTFNNSALSLIGGSWSKDTLNNCTFSSYSVYSLTDSNLVGCGTITIATKRLDRPSYDMSNNYWGDEKTVELEQKTVDDQIFFFYHYTNDFNLTKIVWDDYSKTAFTDCGYQGKGFRTEGSYSGYSIGDIGPAGGIVFYDKGYYSDGWRYLEAAVTDLQPVSIFGFYRPNNATCAYVGTSIGVGAGKENTNLLVEVMDIDGKAYNSADPSSSTTDYYYARICLDYEYGGCDDWFLPSKVELKLMYTNLHKKGLGSFEENLYWSSSEFGVFGAWRLNFYDGCQESYDRNCFSSSVRPVRAF